MTLEEDCVVQKTTMETVEENDQPLPSSLVKTRKKKSSPYGVWIGNLHFSTQSSHLLQFVTETVGLPSSSIVRLKLPMQSKSKTAALLRTNKGFAYMDFVSADARDAVLQCSESMLHGRRLLIKDARSTPPVQSTTELKCDKVQSKKAEARPSFKLFLGHLPFDATREELTSLLSPFGPVVAVRLATFMDTDRCKGYAHVIMQSVDGARRVMEDRHQLKLRGHALKVEYGKQVEGRNKR